MNQRFRYTIKFWNSIFQERRLLEEDRKIREEIRRRKSCAQYPQDRAGGRIESRPKKPTAAPRCKEYTVSEEDIEKTYTGNKTIY